VQCSAKGNNVANVAAPRIVNGSAFVPLAAVCQAFTFTTMHGQCMIHLLADVLVCQACI
jgi:hypothetical protein